MDHGACNVIYLDRRAQAKTFRRDSVVPEDRQSVEVAPKLSEGEYFDSTQQLADELRRNIQSILTTFNEGTFWESLCAR